jgi:hypothetical protein
VDDGRTVQHSRCNVSEIGLDVLDTGVCLETGGIRRDTACQPLLSSAATAFVSRSQQTGRDACLRLRQQGFKTLSSRQN